jgi:hypothetical protein
MHMSKSFIIILAAIATVVLVAGIPNFIRAQHAIIRPLRE